MIRRNRNEAMDALRQRVNTASRAELEALIAGEFTDRVTREMAEHALRYMDSAKSSAERKRRFADESGRI